MTPITVPEPEAFVSAGEAAKVLGLSRNAVKRRYLTGFLQGYVDPFNGYYYFTQASVLALSEQGRQLRLVAVPLRGSQ